MNINDLDKATSLRGQLSKVREQKEFVRNAGVALSPRGYHFGVHVKPETLAAITTLATADLDAQEAGLVKQLADLGVTEKPATGGAFKSFADGGLVDGKINPAEVFIASAILGEIASGRRRAGRVG